MKPKKPKAKNMKTAKAKKAVNGVHVKSDANIVNALRRNGSPPPSAALDPQSPQSSPPQAAICKSAMLAKLSVSTWSARKFDRKVSDEVASAKNADRDAGRYNKHLFGGSKAAEAHTELIAEAGAARQTHYIHTLPWDDSGWRLLPNGVYMDYVDFLGQMRTRFDAAVDKFVQDYPALRAAAKAKLGDLYRDEDYPSESEVRSRFSMHVEYAPIPASGDFRLDLPAAAVEEIERATRERVESATKVAVQDLWTRMRDVVSKARERLADKDAVFRDSLILNIGDVADLLKQLNFTNDPAIEAMRQRLDSELATLEPDDLREDAALRDKAAANAAAILESMSSIYGGAS